MLQGALPLDGALVMSSEPCVSGNLDFRAAFNSAGTWSNSLEDFNEIYNKSIPFLALRLDYADYASRIQPDYLQFAVKASQNAGAESGVVYSATHEFFSVFLNNAKRVEKNCMVGYPQSQAVSYIDGVTFGAAFSMYAKVIFKNESLANQFKNDLNSFAGMAVFSDSSIQPAAVTAELKKLGAVLYVSAIQLGGDLDNTREFIKTSTCNVDNIADCRKLVYATYQNFFAQLPKTQDQDALQKLEPLNTITRELQFLEQ